MHPAHPCIFIVLSDFGRVINHPHDVLFETLIYVVLKWGTWFFRAVRLFFIQGDSTTIKGSGCVVRNYMGEIPTRSSWLFKLGADLSPQDFTNINGRYLRENVIRLHILGMRLRCLLAVLPLVDFVWLRALSVDPPVVIFEVIAHTLGHGKELTMLHPTIIELISINRRLNYLH